MAEGHIRKYPILKHLLTFSLTYYAAKGCIVVFPVKAWHVKKDKPLILEAKEEMRTYSRKKHTKVPLNRSRFPRSHLPDNRSRSSWDDVQWPIMQNVLLLSDDRLVFLGSAKSKLISHCLKIHTNKQV